MTTLSGKTPDIAEENIAKLKEIFPDVFEEGKVDFDKLKQVLGEYVDDNTERYNFSWNGKGRALRLAQSPSTGTLRPCPEESKDWDTTQNLYIEGDNLEVLKLLQKSYHGKVKMIYIDPPYNTGGDFVYPDDYSDSIENYLRITGQKGEDGAKISTNTEASGRYHTDWLNMMYPRLRLARNLLSDDGVAFISIDDNEIENLKKICNEVFGESNFESLIAWRRRHNQPNDKTKMIAKVSEHILVYAKSSQYLAESKGYYGLPLTDERISEYKNPDNDINGRWTSNPWKAAVGRGGTYYTLTTPSGKSYTETWYGNADTFKKLIADNRVHWTDNGNGLPRIKVYLKDAIKEGQAAINFFTHERFGSNQEGSSELEELFNAKGIFDNPKPVKLIKSLSALVCNSDSIILDFFSGSATTAQVVVQMNSQDGGRRKYILVQLPEPCNETSEAYKSGYMNICEIGKERIRRAGDKIKEESGLMAQNLDIGFKVFKLDTSNVKKWNAEAVFEMTEEKQLQFNAEKLEEILQNSVGNFVAGRTETDVVYEIMIKMGLDLTYPVEETEVDGEKVYSVGLGALMICLADNITTAVADGMVKLYQEEKPETWKVVFKDNGFADDSTKTNVREILKCAGLDEDAFTTL